jgi:hypothetical protein
MSFTAQGRRLAACMTPILFLAACGSGGSSTQALSYQQMFDAAEGNSPSLLDDALALTEQQGSTIPTSGTANYAGFLRFDLPSTHPNNIVYGEMAMTVDFAPAVGGVTGTVTNLRDDSDTAWVGTLNITPDTTATIDRAADPTIPLVNVFHAELNGTLAGTGGNWVVDGPLMGDFHGANQEFMQGATGSTGGATLTDPNTVVTPTIIEWVVAQ